MADTQTTTGGVFTGARVGADVPKQFVEVMGKHMNEIENGAEPRIVPNIHKEDHR